MDNENEARAGWVMEMEKIQTGWIVKREQDKQQSQAGWIMKMKQGQGG